MRFSSTFPINILSRRGTRTQQLDNHCIDRCGESPGRRSNDEPSRRMAPSAWRYYAEESRRDARLLRTKRRASWPLRRSPDAESLAGLGQRAALTPSRPRTTVLSATAPIPPATALRSGAASRRRTRGAVAGFASRSHPRYPEIRISSVRALHLTGVLQVVVRQGRSDGGRSRLGGVPLAPGGGGWDLPWPLTDDDVAVSHGDMATASSSTR